MNSFARRQPLTLGALLCASLAASCSGTPDVTTVASITQAASAAGEYAYTFDATGLMASVGNGTTSLPITRSGDTLHAGTNSYTFDALGRVVAVDDLALAYGPDDQIATATRGGQVVSYLYDENGERLLKSVNGTPTEAYVEEGHVTATELDEPVRVADKLVGLLRNGSFVLAATDSRGTVQADTDGTQRLASPFGARPVHPDVAAAVDYAERGFDADLGADRMGARDYDARIGRFLQPDPLFLVQPEKCLDAPQECNLYGYARGQPADRVDPTGHETLVFGGGFIGFLSGNDTIKGTVGGLFPAATVVGAPRFIYGGAMKNDPAPAVHLAETFVHTQSQRNLVGWSLGADTAAMAAGAAGPAGGGKWDYVVMVGGRVDRVMANLEKVASNAEHVVVVNLIGDHYGGPAGKDWAFGDRSFESLDKAITAKYGSILAFERLHPNVTILPGDAKAHIGGADRPAQNTAIAEGVHRQATGYVP